MYVLNYNCFYVHIFADRKRKYYLLKRHRIHTMTAAMLSTGQTGPSSSLYSHGSPASHQLTSPLTGSTAAAWKSGFSPYSSPVSSSSFTASGLLAAGLVSGIGGSGGSAGSTGDASSSPGSPTGV